MDFVNDVDFILACHRHMVRFFAQSTHMFHAVAAGGVDFYNIQTAFGCQGFAGTALAARFAIPGIFAIYRFGKNTRNSGFADTAGAHQQIGVPHPVAGNRVAQSTDNVGLTDHIAEFLRPPLTGDYLMTAHNSTLFRKFNFFTLCRAPPEFPAAGQKSASNRFRQGRSTH